MARMFADELNGEVVIAVRGSTVVTQRDRLITTYSGVRGRYSVGDKLADRPPHVSRNERATWSPFDEPDDVNDDQEPRRVF